MKNENEPPLHAGRRILRLVKGSNRQWSGEGNAQAWRDEISMDLLIKGRGVPDYWVDTSHGPAAIREAMIAEGLIEVRADALQRLSLKGLEAHLTTSEDRSDFSDAGEDDVAYTYMVIGRIGEMMWDRHLWNPQS
jgi:hypothetical protein